MDVPGLTRLRAGPAYDDLTDAEHVAVLDASELLDELRRQGYGFTLLGRGALKVAPPAGAAKEAKARIAAPAPALAYVLRPAGRRRAAARRLPDVRGAGLAVHPERRPRLRAPLPDRQGAGAARAAVGAPGGRRGAVG